MPLTHFQMKEICPGLVVTNLKTYWLVYFFTLVLILVLRLMKHDNSLSACESVVIENGSKTGVFALHFLIESICSTQPSLWCYRIILTEAADLNVVESVSIICWFFHWYILLPNKSCYHIFLYTIYSCISSLTYTQSYW